MKKKNIEAFNKPRPLFSGLKSYSVGEILAAGGTTAFANKMGKSAEGLEDALKKLPKEAFLTEEEFSEAMKTLNENK
ncbi:hypothetical protein [Mucilaginibacter gotjawali]|uniref:Uncharacterized protein n=1 Tax=Mucilaginibacter gotjawali TaxID=1550579 RepID=A0A839SQS8_9SPHI|nr:hypothetical protein [Mucilaginibacter gotjawali]MBB3059180.1 hypothetical protein [Mucilaginibacter gotjawali]